MSDFPEPTGPLCSCATRLRSRVDALTTDLDGAVTTIVRLTGLPETTVRIQLGILPYKTQGSSQDAQGGAA